MCTTNKICRIIAIANQKGDVGKTTTTSNLGIDLMLGNIELSGLEVSLMNVMRREIMMRSYVDMVKNSTIIS